MVMIGLAQAPGRLWGSYMKVLKNNPVKTKMGTSVAAAFLGDVIAQHASKPSHAPDWSLDWARTARMCVFNAGMGCFGHFYYGALDQKVGVLTPTSPATILKKVAIDQLLFAPLCTLIFYAYKVVSEYRARNYTQELRDKLWPTIKAGWMLWPAAHVLNFAFVPTHHRVLYANAVSVAGTYLLSRAAAGDFSTKKDDKLHGQAQSLAIKNNLPNEVLFDGVTVKIE